MLYTAPCHYYLQNTMRVTGPDDHHELTIVTGSRLRSGAAGRSHLSAVLSCHPHYTEDGTNVIFTLCTCTSYSYIRTWYSVIQSYPAHSQPNLSSSMPIFVSSLKVKNLMTSNQVKMQSNPLNWETPQTLEILVTGDALCAPCTALA